jgi:hypothetical protein
MTKPLPDLVLDLSVQSCDLLLKSYVLSGWMPWSYHPERCLECRGVWLLLSTPEAEVFASTPFAAWLSWLPEVAGLSDF